MTRDEFNEILKNRLDEFNEHWEMSGKLDGKEDWPDELPNLVDWFEQFVMWFEG